MTVATPFHLDLPPVYCPIPAAVNDGLAECERRGLEWMSRHGFCADEDARRRVLHTDAAEWCARMVPDAGRDRLQLATDWTYLMFVFDDLLCDTGEASTTPDVFVDIAARMVHLLEVPDGATMDPANPFTAPVRDLALRFRLGAGDVQVRRWIDAHRAWLFGVAWQIAARSAGTRLDLNLYTVMRLGSCAGFPVAVMGEEEEVPVRELNAPAVRALTEVACLVAAWDNDLLSYGKELWHADRAPVRHEAVPGNLVDLLIQHDGHSLAQALEHATRMRDHLMLLFLRLREQVRPTASTPLRRYLEMLGTTIRAGLDVGVKTARYTDPDGAHPGAIRITSGIADVPPAGAEDPLPIPAIAWWWELLGRDTA